MYDYQGLCHSITSPLSHPLDSVHDAVLETCKEMNAEVKDERKKVLFRIPIRNIVEVAATSHVIGRIRKGNDFVLEVVFHDHARNKRSIIMNIEEQYVNRIQQQITAIMDSELGINEVIWGELDKLCTICIKYRPELKFNNENICTHCFEEKYGKISLKEETGEYHGGHKVHLAGGSFGDYEYGRMYLTDKYRIFAKGNKNPFKRWETEIPINSIVLEQWGVKAETRRKHIVGGSTAVTSNFAFGGSCPRSREETSSICSLHRGKWNSSNPYLVSVH
jgi:hypothetical protein